MEEGEKFIHCERCGFALDKRSYEEYVCIVCGNSVTGIKKVSYDSIDIAEMREHATKSWNPLSRDVLELCDRVRELELKYADAIDLFKSYRNAMDRWRKHLAHVSILPDSESGRWWFSGTPKSLSGTIRTGTVNTLIEAINTACDIAEGIHHDS
jgi:hypothetical protein